MIAYQAGSPSAASFQLAKRFAAERNLRQAALQDIKAIRADPSVRLGWDHLAGVLETKRCRRLEFLIRRNIIDKFGVESSDSFRSLHRLALYSYLIGDIESAQKFLVTGFKYDTNDAKWLRNIIWLHQSQYPLITDDELIIQLSNIRELKQSEIKLIFYRSNKRKKFYNYSIANFSDKIKSIQPRAQRVAVLVSGQLRDYEVGLKNIREFIAAPLNADVFIHTWNRSGIPRIGRAISAEFLTYLRSRNLPTDERLAAEFPIINQVFGSSYPSVSEIKNLSSAISVVLEEEPESLRIHRSIENVNFPSKWAHYSYGSLPMYYKIRSCFSIMSQYEHNNDIKYDIIIRVRPDLSFSTRIPNKILSEVCRTRSIYVNSFHFDHCDDQFAIGTRDVMERYSTLFDYLPDYWSDRGGVPGATMALGEHILFQHLFYEGIQISAIPWTKPPMLLDRKIGYRDLVSLSKRPGISAEEQKALQFILGTQEGRAKLLDS